MSFLQVSNQSKYPVTLTMHRELSPIISQMNHSQTTGNQIFDTPSFT